MPVLISLAALFLLACSGAARRPPDPPPPAPTAERVELRIQTATRLTTFSRRQTITLRDLGGHQVRVAAPSLLQLRQHPQGGGGEVYLRYQTFGALEWRQDDEVQPLGAFMRGLDRHQVRTRVDRHNRIDEGPELTGSPHASPQLSAAVLGLSRLLELALPERPVAVGEHWSEPAALWRAEPAGLAGIEMERSWTLVGIDGPDEERVARIAWDVHMRVQPFEISGVSVEGRGRMQGLSELSLRDGVAGTAVLDVSLELGPTGASDVLSLYRVQATIRERIEPGGAPVRGAMIQGVRPSRSSPIE